MSDHGVHAELEVADESICRIASGSETARVKSVSRSAPPGADTVTVEFTADATADLDGVREVFHHGDEIVYRFEREAGEAPECPCEVVEMQGCPVRHQQVDGGAVVFSFVADDLEMLQQAVVTLRETYDGVSLRRLTRSEHPDASDDLVFVDRTALTDRQREVLETAHELGYFDHPKGKNATEVADALDINRSTFAEHLSAAQSKILDSILEPRT